MVWLLPTPIGLKKGRVSGTDLLSVFEFVSSDTKHNTKKLRSTGSFLGGN